MVIMKSILTLSFLAGCLGVVSSAATLYGVTGSDIYTITETAGAFTFSAGSAIGTVTGTVSDIADYNGQLYLATYTNLYKISTSGVVTSVGSFGLGGTDIVGLTFGQNGVLYGTAVGTSTDYYTINTTTGAATGVATTGATGGINSSGDEEVIGNLLYVTTGGDSGGNSSLATINLTNGTFTNLGLIHTGGTDYADVYGLVVADGTLYGFTGSGQILNFGLVSAISVSVTTVTASGTPDFYGTTDDVLPAVPEPATFGAMGLGLLALGAFARRRKV